MHRRRSGLAGPDPHVTVQNVRKHRQEAGGEKGKPEAKQHEPAQRRLKGGGRKARLRVHE